MISTRDQVKQKAHQKSRHRARARVLNGTPTALEKSRVPACNNSVQRADICMPSSLQATLAQLSKLPWQSTMQRTYRERTLRMPGHRLGSPKMGQ